MAGRALKTPRASKENRHRGTGSLWPCLAVLAPLAAFAFLAVHAAGSLSVTFDEVAHLPAGYTHLAWGDFRLNPEQPPLVKELAAAPLLLAGAKAPPRNGSTWSDAVLVITNYWEFGRQFLFQANAPRVERLIYLARLPLVAVALAVGVLLFFWARELFGSWPAAAVVALFALDSNWIGHGSLVTLDVAYALCWLGASYFLWRLLRSLTVANAAGAALFLALAQVAKFNAPVLVALVVLFGVYAVARRGAWDTQVASLRQRLDRRAPRAAAVAVLVAVFAIAAFATIWAAYRFRLAPTPDGQRFPVAMRIGELRAQGRQPGGWQAGVTAPLAGLAHRYGLLPESYVYGLASAVSGAQERIAYLHGKFSTSGWWYYFPVAMAVKMPLPTLVLALLGGGLLLRKRSADRAGPSALLLALAPGLLYLGVSMASRINIGVRHVLPVFPFIYLLAGVGVSWLLSSSRRSRLFLALLGVWLLVGTARIHPHHLAYFNELAGGPTNGPRWLLDSNIDWGQDLKTLKRWLDGHGVERINLAYWGTGDPAAYGIDYVPLPGLTAFPGQAPRQPELPGYVAISVNNLVAAPPEVRASYRRWIERGTLVARLGYSIYVYKVP